MSADDVDTVAQYPKASRLLSDPEPTSTLRSQHTQELSALAAPEGDGLRAEAQESATYRLGQVLSTEGRDVLTLPRQQRRNNPWSS